MKETFVVVDMQPDFEPAKCDRICENIVKEIGEARKRQAHIMIVEFQHYGYTRPEILRALAGYGDWSVVLKNHDDGSREVLAKCENNGIPRDKLTFTFSGVNWQFCVYSTVKGLHEKGIPKENLNVLESCCNGPHYSDWESHREYYNDFAIIEYDEDRDEFDTPDDYRCSCGAECCGDW